MSQENFWILFSKKIANEASPEELAELEKLIQQHPEWQYAVQNLQDIWSSQSPTDRHSADDAYLLHLQRMKEKNISFGQAEEEEPVSRKAKSGRTLIYTVVTLAACLLVLIVLYIRPGKQSGEKISLRDISEVSTRLGSKSRIQLPDGSVVWINSGSKLTYNKEFGKNLREVYLTGEAFFDVSRDETRPFLIHTNSIDIKVLGTAFNVKAYPEDRTTEASLIRGSIEVSIKARPADKVILAPNEKLVVENKGPVDTVRSTGSEERLMVINKIRRDKADSTVLETQWTENKLVFDDELFEEVAVKMERWFNVDIEISDQKLAKKRLTGKFENESIEQALESLAYTSTLSFEFERKGNKIIIYR